MTPEECPNCHASMRGQPIPEDMKKYYIEGLEFFSRVISVVDRDDGRHWKCPDCQHEWPNA
jgi:hypothetical protein